MAQHPHKSTTHEERYVHLHTGQSKFWDHPQAMNGVIGSYRGHTVFFRKIEDGWYGSASHCVYEDGFNKAIGRTTARRRWFAGKVFKLEAEPTYDLAFTIAIQDLGGKVDHHAESEAETPEA